MKRHDTPNDVARELARHAPCQLRAVLEPAAGSGALLLPLIRQLKKQGSELFCVDSDAKAINELKKNLHPLLRSKVKLANADFLAWSERKDLQRFDCVVMNPPFAAGKANLCKVRMSDSMQAVIGKNPFMPLEAAFVCRAVDLLKDNGRLLAVLPCSVIMSQSTQWLRDLLLEIGAIRFVHELPPNSFPNVESRMYLFVFDKAASQRKIVLFNHDLAVPERLDVWLSKYHQIDRLDFGYHRAAQRLNRLFRCERFGWQALSEVASVLRGDIKSPLGPMYAVHTSDYKSGFWRRSERHNPLKYQKADYTIRRGDLLVKRVGRNSHKTFGRAISLRGMPCSDCVLIIRPEMSSVSTRLLFSLQAMFETKWSKPLIERGTGASYISHESLLRLQIPTRLYECFPKTYASFMAAQNGRSAKRSFQAIHIAANYLKGGVST